MTLSEKLLSDAKTAWAATVSGHCQSKIRVGTILHEYVYARLKESDEMNEEQRRVSRLSRRTIIEDAALTLDISGALVNDLIRTAMTVALLADDTGDIKTLSYSSVRLFAFAVYRLSATRKAKRGFSLRDGEAYPHEQELWGVRPGVEWAVELFRQVVKENWKADEIENKLVAQQVRKRKKSIMDTLTETKTRKETRAVYDILQDVAKRSNSKDFAEMLLSLIKHNSDPEAVAAILSQHLSHSLTRS